jgi:transposase
MAWTEITRRQYRRDTLRYASNLTDDEWSLIRPFLSCPALLGRPRSVDLRVIVNAILFMAATGCQWRQIQKEFAPFTTIQGYFTAGHATAPWGK